MHSLPTIALVSANYTPYVEGGAELIVQFLAECIQRSGKYRPIVISLNPQTSDAVDEVDGVRVYRVGRRNVYSTVQRSKQQRGRIERLAYHAIDSCNVLASSEVRTILEQERPAVVNTHNVGGLSTDVWRQVARAGIPLVHTLHDSYLLCYRTTRFKDRFCEQRCAGCRFGTGIRKWQSRYVNAVIGVSRYIVSTHINEGYFPSATTAVVANGRPLMGAPTCPHRHGWTVGFAGRVERLKGVEVLIEAFVKAGIPGSRLLLAGRGETPYVAMLRERYGADNVHFLGHVPAERFYPQVDVMVLPSLVPEGAGSGYEPWEFGIPVLASKVGGIPETQSFGVGGGLFQAGDVHGLVKLLQHAHAHPLDEAGVEKLRNARRYFVPERQLDETLRVYRDAGAAL